MLGKLKTQGEEGSRGGWLDSITDSMDMNLSNLWETALEDRRTWHAAILWVTKSQTQLCN